MNTPLAAAGGRGAAAQSGGGWPDGAPTRGPPSPFAA